MANFVSRVGCFMQSMATVAAAFILLLMVAAVCASARSSPSAISDASCPIADIAVFPYWSFCTEPAKYMYEGGAYKLASPKTGLFLAPEWDETNSTYYVRLAEEGATYAFSHSTRERRPFVGVSERLNIINVDTGRGLTWQYEGEDEFFLVEVDNVDVGFEFVTYDNLSLACPRIYPPAQCKGYSIRDFKSSLGFAPYVEDDVTYFKRSSTDLSAFTLLRTSSPSPSENKKASVV